MKKLLIPILILLCGTVFSQPVVNRSSSAVTVQDSRWIGQYNMVVPRFADTTSANLQIGVDSAGAMIKTYNPDAFWYRQSFPKRWIRSSSSSNSPPPSVVSIIDSFHFQICNVNSCDTFTTTVIAQTIQVTNDTTIIICSYGNNLCDTFIINQTPIIPPGVFVDTVFVNSSPKNDTLITSKSGDTTHVNIFDRNCGLISPGVVTNDTLLKLDVSPAIYILCSDGIRRTSAQTNVTLTAADATNPRIDAIILDATGVTKITGTAAANPVAPSILPSQILLTYILVPATATTLTCTTPDITLYDENTGTPEWLPTATGVTVDYSNTIAPYRLTKAASAGAFTNGQSLNFAAPAAVMVRAYSYLKFYVRLKATFSNSTSFQVSFVTLAGSASVNVTNNTYGFSRNTINTYQVISIPISDFSAGSAGVALQLSIPATISLKFTLLGSNATGFYIDYIQLGGSCITQPPPAQNIYTATTRPGLGVPVLAGQVGNDFQFKRIKQGLNVTVTEGIDSVTIASTTFATNQAIRDTILENIFYFYQPVTATGKMIKPLTVNSALMLAIQFTTGFDTTASSDTIKVIKIDTSLIATKYYVNSSNGFTTADNGLTANTATNVQLGGTLLANTTIDATALYKINITGSVPTSTADGVLIVNNTAVGFGTAIKGVSVNSNGIWGVSEGIGVRGESVDGGGIWAQSTNNLALYALSTNSVVAQFNTQPASTNTIVPMLQIDRSSTGAGADGIGLSIDFYNNVSTGAGNLAIANQLISKWTTANNATRTSSLVFTGVLSASTVNLITLAGDGSMLMRPITATAGSAITPAEGMIIFVSDTNGTFLTVGFWGYQGGVWVKM